MKNAGIRKRSGGANFDQLVSDYLIATVQHQQGLIEFSDQKANILLGLIGIILSVFIKDLMGGIINSWQLVLLIAPFIVAGYSAFLALLPRSSTSSSFSSKLSLFYYGSASRIESSKISKALMEASVQDVYGDYTNTIKALAILNERKFRYIRLAYLAFVVGVLAKVYMSFTNF
ncbi:MAG: hypothetical protein KGZ30_02615 [Anaplasmataceae bacterium]|nr:hypothetical protein [Anaplasmataceae bacterium]